MNRTTLRNALAVALTTAFLAGCHGGGNSIPSVGAASGPRHNISITITRGSATAASTTRAPQTIPNNAQSVDARIYLGSTATGAPVSTACVSFPAGTTSTTLTIGSPTGALETIVISSWSGTCSNSEGSGQLLTTFSGTGTVSASSTTVAQVFNAGAQITLQPPSAPVSGTIPAVQFTNLGPVWQNVLNATTINGDLAGSGKIQSVVPVGPSTQTSPAQIIYIAGGDGNGFEVNVSAGIYKTVDGGQTWYPIGYDNGLTDTRVNDIYVDQSNPNVVLAATYFGGVFRSTDGGSSWTQVDPNAPATHFAQLGSTIYVADSVGVEQSTDDGATWSTAGTGFSSAGNAYGTGADSIAAAPPSTLIAGDYNGYTWSFNGTTWTQGGQLAATALGCGSGGNSAPAAVHTIAIDQATPSTVWATGWSCTMGGQAVSQELYLSTNGGATWNDVATQANSNGVGGNPAGYYGSQMLANSVNFAHSIDTGAEFTQWRATPDTSTTPPSASYTAVNGQTSTTQGNTYGDMRGLTVVSNGAGGDACYIASDQGLYYEGTCGQSAGLPRVLTGGLSTNFLYGFGVGGTVGSETIMTTIQDFGPAATATAGNGGGLSASDWTGTFGGASSLNEGGDAEISPFNASDCVVSQTSKPALNYSTDGCLSFNPSSPSTLASVSSLSFSRKTAGLLFIADGSGGLYKSTDDGAVATQVAGANALLTGGYGVSFIRVDPENDNNLFAIVTNASTGSGAIEYSTNGGGTWTASLTTFTTAPAALAIDPQNSSDIVAVGGSGALTIYTSTNGGVSFTSSSPSGLSVARQAMSVLARRTQTFPLRFAPPRPPWRFDGINGRLSPPVAPEEWVKAAIQPQYATAIEFNPNAPAGQDPILALSTGFGLFASPDLGTTWTRLDTPGSGAISRRFTKVEWLGGYLYASTDGQGLLRSTGPLQ
ncbi:MAG: hypothetical protein HKL92_01670 [Candidatus Eremiobacteraeota bacterium]|nr:hypothetical protein [Candidatus Eremiobacteraeota bacterium]NNM92030.1 hypothetical protein [Candidatus Eremiobacteraeota bacterium]